MVTGTAVAIVVRVPESYPWWYNAWTAITGGTGTGTVAWLTAASYTLYEELNIMVLSNIVRERDRKAAEARVQDIKVREQEVDARQQEVDARQQDVETQRQDVETQRQEIDAQRQDVETQRQEIDAQRQEIAEKERALQSLAEHLPPQYQEELERLAGNGKETEKEQ